MDSVQQLLRRLVNKTADSLDVDAIPTFIETYIARTRRPDGDES